MCCRRMKISRLIGCLAQNCDDSNPDISYTEVSGVEKSVICCLLGLFLVWKKKVDDVNVNDYEYDQYP